MNYLDIWNLFYFINIFKFAPLISFVGTDGSGKSTLAKKLKKELENMQIKNKIISAGVFSRIKFLKKRKKKYSEKVGSLEKRNISSNLEICARIIMQIPNQLKILYLRKKGILVITDRYIYDLITLFGAEEFWKKFIKTFSQKPTKIFYISAPSKLIYQRNKELNLKSIEKVQNMFEENSKFLEFRKIKNENLLKSTKEILNENWRILKNEL